MKLLIEAASKRFEREHNARVWLAWHVAALSRMKKLPDLKRMILNNTSKPRQNWREQLVIMAEWAAHHEAWLNRQKEKANGR